MHFGGGAKSRWRANATRSYLIIGLVFFMTAAAVASHGAERNYSLRDLYILGSDNRVKVIVSGEDDLSGTFEIRCIVYLFIGEVE